MKYTMLSMSDKAKVDNIKDVIKCYNNAHHDKIEYNIEEYKTKYSDRYYVTIEGNNDAVDNVLGEMSYYNN